MSIKTRERFVRKTRDMIRVATVYGYLAGIATGLAIAFIIVAVFG